MSDTVTRAEYEDLLRRVEALEAGKGRKRGRGIGPRDQHERELVMTIGRLVGGQRIKSSDLLKRYGRQLRSALKAADIDTTRRFGKFLSQVSGVPVGDVVIRPTETRGGPGCWWDVGRVSVQVVDTHHSERTITEP